MKEVYEVKSDRNGYTHKFTHIKDDLYNFSCYEDWMPISITYGKDYSDIKFIDPDSGPCIGEGWNNGVIEVTEIIVGPKSITFRLKEIAHE